MAVPAYTSDLTDIVAPTMIVGEWTAYGGGGAALDASDPSDYFIIDSNCIAKGAWASDYKGILYDNTTDITVPAGDALFVWLTHLTANSLATEAAGGLRVVCGDSATESALDEWYVGGSDTVLYDDRWLCAVVDIDETPDNDNAATQDYSWFGAGANLPTGGPTKGDPFGIGAIRYGREYQCTAGEAADYATFDGAATYNDDSTRRYGQFQLSKGTYSMQGLFVMGTAVTAVDFRDSNRVIFVARTPKVGAGFNGFEVRNASSRVDWTNVSIQALGTQSPGYFEMIDDATVNFTTCTFTDLGTFIFDSNATVLGCVWRSCGQITGAGGDFTGSSIAAYTGVANTSSFVWNLATDTDGNLDEMEFTQDATVAHHAIEFGALIPASITLRSLVFTDFDADDTDGSALHFLDTTGTITVNLFDMATPTYRSAGATILFVNAKDVTMQVSNANDLTDIEDATVLLLAATGGNLPYQDTVTITSSGTTATVTHTAHAIPDGEKVEIKNAVEPAYNGIFVTTFISTSSYSYTMLASTTSPATGTILATGVILAGLTSALGVLARTDFPFSADQPVAGRVRKNPPAPYFSQALIPPGTLDTNGFSATALMIPD